MPKNLPPCYWVSHWIQRLNDISRAVYNDNSLTNKIENKALQLEVRQTKNKFDTITTEYHAVVMSYVHNNKVYLDAAYEEYMRSFWPQLESSLAVFELSVRKAKECLTSLVVVKC